MEYDVIIVGAGASGLMAAITAARQGSKVLVLEQKDKAGKKILATGNGKCNFTNKYQAQECYRSEDSSFAMKVLSRFDTSKTLQFFEELGIYPKEREGYYYPNSEQAASIVSVLMMECERLKVCFHYNETVKEINKPDYTILTEILPNEIENNKKSGTNKSNNNKTSNDKTINDKASNDKLSNKSKPNFNTYFAKKLLLSTGGCASPKLGSDGSGYVLAKSLGHGLIKPLPALVQLQSPERYCKTVSGVRTQASVEAMAGQNQLATETGEIIFTDYGISGIPVMQISRFVAKAIDHGEKVYLKLDYLPTLSRQELNGMLVRRIKQNPAKSAEELLVGLLNHKLSYIILLEAGIDPYKASKAFTNQEIEAIISGIKEFNMKITGTNSFENAQVCAGGIPTDEINELTMESKLRKGLYLTGELIDVDGTCGGYNLQWAWSSGYLAGLHAGRNVE